MQVKMHYKQSTGFTLIEIMITVAIIGILAAVALPMYSDFLVRGRLVEAVSTLSGHRVKMEQYFMDNRTYAGACAAGTVATVPAATENWVFACNPVPNATTYTITATGQNSLRGFVFTIDQSNARATVVTGDAMAKGYASSATCWVRKKPNQC